MRFSLVATALIPVLSAAAEDILVTVGGNNLLAFSPTNVTANVGDTISFQFQSKNHSVTQSTFANPCAIQTTPAQGIDSGFQLVPPGSTSLPQWSFTVNNASAPLWFFCAQTIPANHCQMGMVFSVNANPNSDKSFAVYQAKALGNNVAAGASSAGDDATAIASSFGAEATSIGGDATSIGGSIAGDATSIGGSIPGDATSFGGGIAGEATSAAGDALTGLFGGPSPTSSAPGNSSQSQGSAGFRLERSASLPVLAVVGLAGVLLL